MRHYNIAFFTADWNYELVESTLQGLLQFVDAHPNVSLRVFDCFGKDEDNARERSEYAIFDLPHLDRFDGVLIQANQIVLKAVRDALSERILALGIPAVTVDCPVEGCTLLSIDDHQAQYEITDHIIRVHGARRMVYITGLLHNGSPEARQRLEGFRDACMDNGIDPETECEVIEATWRTSDGTAVAEDWLRTGKPLPDAFVCGNDEMALGLMEYLSDHHVRIPDDVMVTGFDNVYSAELSSPRLTTIQRNYTWMMYQAMTVLIDRINGSEARTCIPFQHGVVCSESCGCPSAAPSGYIRDRYYRQTRFLKSFYMRQDEMAGALLNSENMTELMRIVNDNRSIFGCDKVFLCINDYYFDHYDKNHRHHDSESFGDQMVLIVPGDSAPSIERFPTKELLPKRALEGERFLVFYPLHYNMDSIGYIAMNGISEAAKMNLHKSVFDFIEIAAENVRKKDLLRQLNSELESLYVRDALTHVYNRFGLESVGREAFDAYMAQDGCAQILFIDMDDMKSINDHFGHEMGDLAIRTTAELILAACEGAFVMRYGGDEFLIIASGKAIGLDAAIQGNVAARRACRDLPFCLSLSIGIIRSEKAHPRTLDDCVLAADALMYEMKKRRHAANNRQ